jgi:hypothetical protein
MSIKNELETLENRPDILEDKRNEICVKYICRPTPCRAVRRRLSPSADAV